MRAGVLIVQRYDRQHPALELFMSIAISGIVVLIFVAAVGFFVVRRAMRLAIRLTLIGAVLLAALIGAFWWWYTSGASTTNTPSTQTERRANGTQRRSQNSMR